MSERFFRIILGVILLVIIYFDSKYAIYTYVAIVLFEGVTNFRIPGIISRVRYGQYPDIRMSTIDTRFNFEAERALRIAIAVLIIVSYVLYAELLWFLPWFIGIMLVSAGITNICPMFMSFKWLGFR